MNSLFLLICSLSFFTTGPIFKDKPPTVKQILHDHTRAMGGKESWSKLRSYQLTYQKVDGRQMVMTCLLPDKITLHFRSGDDELIKGFDGKHGYLVRNGLYEPMRPGEAIEMAEEVHYFSELIFARDHGYPVKLLGEEHVEEARCYKLIMTKSASDEQVYWINKETHLIEQTGEYSEDKAHDGIYYKTRLEDYRPVDGLMFPFKQTIISSKGGSFESSIAHAVKNAAKIEDHRFSYQPDNTKNMIRYWKDRYANDQLKAFTFTQETIRFRDGVSDTSTWHEAIQYPDHFRIDLGEKAALNRNLYRNDSIYVMRAGKIVHKGKKIQEFMLMEGGLYHLPIDSTIQKLKKTGIDPDLFYTTTYRDRKTYVIGASEGDIERPQVWLDAKRRSTVRRFMRLENSQILEVIYDGFKQIDGFEIETDLEFYIGDKLIQTERYYNIKANPSIKDEVFSPKRLNSAYWY